jgi:hypothetical protein
MEIKTIEMTKPDEFDYAVTSLCNHIEIDHEILDLRITHFSSKYVATIIFVTKQQNKPYTPARKNEIEIPGDPISMKKSNSELFDFLAAKELERR